MKYTVDERGYYGNFGGAYIPEMLYPNVEELRNNYLRIISDPAFQKENDKESYIDLQFELKYSNAFTYFFYQ